MSVIDSGVLDSGVVVGGARVLYAPDSVAIPADIADIIAMENSAGVYAPATGWEDFGFSTGPSSYSRSFESTGLEFEQTTALRMETISAVNRSCTVNAAEIRPEVLQIMENAAAVDTIAAVAGASAQKAVKFGSFTSRESYRIAIIEQRPIEAGVVTETDVPATTRGRLVAHVLYNAVIAGDEVSISVAKNSPTAFDLTFTAQTESGEASGEEVGVHLFEDAGTIT